MWFTEVKPRNRDAAGINVAAEDETTLNVTVGNIWFEMFGPVERNLPQLREIIEGVFAGRLEESGTRERAYGRVLGQSRTFRIGHMHLPLLWSLRRPRRYVPYDA